jgi:phosphoribosylformimino-5-aminoimidazole carboxamide ribotide isomerase
MEIIPVIDLKDGAVVRALKGDRAHYRPITTPLAPTGDPLEVARGLLSVFPFQSLYVADLDAITGSGDNRAVLASLTRAFPHVSFWIDGGIAEPDAAAAWLADETGILVIGSESQKSTALARRFADHPRVVLSLDFRGDAFCGPPELLTDTACWASRIIAMTMGRVGSGEGPDLARVAMLSVRAAGRRIYAAGGVRDAADLEMLKRVGAAGALIATCLHERRLTGDDIARLYQPAG